ncbi:PA14 domain-containing protein, partial [Gymnodinialimonas mytili]|uniref:PA14 domain-containing protein n=1 Tax=Gymnodinialimonas mytili TaxID=3126503 RepID=UPI0030EEDA91
MVKFFALSGGVERLSDVDFSQAATATATVSELDYATTRASFWENGATDNFAAKFEGNLTVNEGGTYTFFLTSDDGSMLYLNGKPIIDNDLLHATRTLDVTVELQAGTHDLELRYFEAEGKQTLQLEWAGPDSGGARSIITGANLGHKTSTDDAPDPTPEPVSGLLASFFELQGDVERLSDVDFSQAATATATVSELDYATTRASFWENGATDNFAAKFEGNLTVN